MLALLLWNLSIALQSRLSLLLLRVVLLFQMIALHIYGKMPSIFPYSSSHFSCNFKTSCLFMGAWLCACIGVYAHVCIKQFLFSENLDNSHSMKNYSFPTCLFVKAELPYCSPHIFVKYGIFRNSFHTNQSSLSSLISLPKLQC